MMKKIYYLSTCSTCKRIMETIDLSAFTLQDIKTEAITEEQLDEMKELSGSYEALFSKTARMYKELNLKNQQLEEADYRRYILDTYTFLKRPVVCIGENIFIGNSKGEQARLQDFFNPAG